MTETPEYQNLEMPSLTTNEPLLTVEEAAKRLRIGRTLMYSLIRSGEIESIPVGRLRRIPAECVNEYVQRLRNVNRNSALAA